jgi:hypothetical protein
MQLFTLKARVEVYQAQRQSPPVAMLVLPQQIINGGAFCHRAVMLWLAKANLID